jgi:two-component system, NtrC family, C4-dicarboxylate transport sensor histidine kinase DctB
MNLVNASGCLLGWGEMGKRILTRFATATLFLALVGAVSTGVWWVSFTSALDQLDTRGRANLALFSDRLVAQMRRYRELAVLLSDHPALVALVEGGGDAARASALLQQKADQTGTVQISLLGRGGAVLATAGEMADADGAAPAFARALHGALGAAHYVNRAGRRMYTFAAPVFTGGGPVLGAILVTVDLSEIEGNWPADPSAVFFTDQSGVVYASSRSELILAQRGPPPSGGSPPAGGPAPAGSVSFPPYRSYSVDAHGLWDIDGGRYLPRQAMHLTQPLPVIGMTGEILIDTAPARRIAFLQAAVAGALALALAAMVLVAKERRRTMTRRLHDEAAANARLEARVEARTLELSSANQTLRREVHERHEAERALRKAQADLVQADKLAALGQMSAGISHELNQPLMAIRSFSENAAAFIGRGKPEVAAENLSRISELARRMGRIIKNLRAFARQEHEEMSDVDLVGVVEATLELAGPRLADDGIDLDWQAPPRPVIVRGGEVRLQQVLMNLVSNAADAMADSNPKRLQIAILSGPGTVRLTVADTGPGIDDPGKLFDPFYSTKAVGDREGLGLGLSISYGLVQSFGGAIRGRNRASGGAEFTVELSASGVEVAA